MFFSVSSQVAPVPLSITGLDTCSFLGVYFSPGKCPPTGNGHIKAEKHEAVVLSKVLI